MADIAKIRLGSTDYDIKDETGRTLINNLSEQIDLIPSSDLNVKIELVDSGLSINLPAGQIAQGMTTDGTYIYMATIDSADGMSNPKMHRIKISDNSITIKQPSKKGHYNNLNFHNGYIYCTGFNANDIAENYSQIYKYNWTNNTGNAITTDEWFWNFAIGEAASGFKYFVGHVGGKPAFNVYTQVLTGSNNFYPFTVCPIEYYNGIEQGCAIYQNRFICTVIADCESVGTHIDSNNEIRVTNLTGETVKRISLVVPNNEELQDICFVGNVAYINTGLGNIYMIPDFSIFFRGFYENNWPAIWKKPCFLYHGFNGSETFYTGSYGNETGRLVKSFRLSPLTVAAHFSDAAGYFVVRSNNAPFRVNPSTGTISVLFAITDNAYSYNFRLTYGRTWDDTDKQYVYTLNRVFGGYRNGTGQYTAFDASSEADIQAVCNQVFYRGDSYIHSVVADPTCIYNYNPTVI